LEAFTAAEVRVEGVVVGDVVAVGRTLRRGEDRRGVEVADAQPFQVGHDRRRLLEGHAVAKLQAVGGDRWGHAGRSLLRAAVSWPKSALPLICSSGTSSLRCQLGYSSDVPGRLVG